MSSQHLPDGAHDKGTVAPWCLAAHQSYVVAGYVVPLSIFVFVCASLYFSCLYFFTSTGFIFVFGACKVRASVYSVLYLVFTENDFDLGVC